MLFFQWPILPELTLCSGCADFVEVADVGRQAKPGTFLQEDLEAFKSTVASYRMHQL